MKTRLQHRLTRVDAAALLVFLAVWVYYIVMVRYGVCFADEGFYVTVAERFVHGERPLVDEWHISQLSCLFLCLPYRIYVALTGGTAGILLFMRYLFVAFNAPVYWFMYIRLRAYKWPALLATALFCAYVPFGIYACNYYTVPIRLLMIVCLLLFPEKQRPLSAWIAGILLSCAVLYQPGFALLYFGYTALVWIRFFRKKKNRPFADSCVFCLQTRTWAHMTLSVLLCAAVFTIWLLTRSGLRNLVESVPYLLTDPEYDFSAQGSAWGVFFRKAAQVGRFYGSLCWIGALVTLALSTVYACSRFRAHRETTRKILFALACAVWIVSCVRMFRTSQAMTVDSYFSVYPAPLFWFGFVCFLLCEQKNKRLLPFWIIGPASSLCVDCISDVSLGIGLPIAYFAVFVSVFDLARELRADAAEQKNKKRSGGANRKKAPSSRIALRLCAGLTCLCFAVWSAFVLFYLENTSVTIHTICAVPLSSETVPCKDGPCRSIRYPEAYEKNYSDKLSDVDSIKSRRPKNLYILNIAPEMYLYAGLPYAVFSTYALGKTKFLDRQIRYWQLHPEKLPECIFVPFDEVTPSDGAAQRMQSRLHESFDPLCEYTTEEGKSGYILYISRWKPDALMEK